MPLPQTREDAIRHLSKAESFRQGYDYYETGAIRKLWVKEGICYAKVGRSRLYKVTIYEKKGAITSSCTCTHIWGGICKHAVAAMLAISRGDGIEEAKDGALITSKERSRYFMSYVDGSNEIDKTSSTYKNEILSELKRLRGKECCDKNPEKYEFFLQSTVDKFVASAGKYAVQKNYKAAVTIYMGICDACIEGLRYKYNRILASSFFRTAQHACMKIGEFAPYLTSSPSEKIPYFDYLIEIYYSLGEPEEFRTVFTQAVKTPDEATYILDKTRLDLPPHIKLDLLSIKGDYNEVVTFGENHYAEHPEIALPLAQFYLIHGQRGKAIAVAKKTLMIVQKSKTGNSFEFFPYIPEEELRSFLNSCYHSTNNYAKA